MTCPPSTSLSPICREQVYGGISGGTAVPGPRLRYPKCPMPPVPTPSSTRSSVACLTSLHPCFCGPCGKGVECQVFSAVVPNSESVSTCRWTVVNRRRRLVPPPRLQVPMKVPVPICQCATTSGVCSPPPTSSCRCCRRTRRHHDRVSSADERDDQPPRAPLDEHAPAIAFARQWQPRRHVAPPLSFCLTAQRYRIGAARSDVTVGGIVCV